MIFRKKYTSEEIITGLLTHDIKVYRYLDAVYRPKVIRHVLNNSGSEEDGKDLYQDIVYRVYVSVEQGKYDAERSGFSTYFMMTTRYAWLNKLSKRKKNVSTTPIDDSYEQITDFDEAEQTEKDVYYRRVQVVRECIAQLSEEEQKMIHLFYFAKKSLEHIAEEMNITYKSSKNKISRVRNKIREMLKEYPDIDTRFI